MNKYQHLTLEEREIMYGCLQKGMSLRSIAGQLKRSHTTLSRELKRHTKYGKSYLPCKAQIRSEKVSKKQRSQAALKSPQVLLYVRRKLRLGWSPETIAGRLPIDIPGESLHHETIYRYIYSPRARQDKLSQYIPQRHRKRRKQNGRSVRKHTKIKNAVSIGNRAKYIEKRKQVGHWETDNMEGPRSSKPALSVTVERAIRYTIISKVPSNESAPKTEVVTQRLEKLPSLLRRTITADNGSENHGHEEIAEKLGVKVYFCHPYHSWEKGTVENMIGRVRRYIPKGTDIEPIPEEYIQQVEYLLNSTPRKCLDDLTPYEKMEQVLKKTFRSR